MAAPVIDDLKRLYRLTWWALMIRGWFALAVGAFMFARPLESVAVFALVIAFWAIFGGGASTRLPPGWANRHDLGDDAAAHFCL